MTTYQLEHPRRSDVHGAMCIWHLSFMQTATEWTDTKLICKGQIYSFVFSSPEPLGSQGELIVYPSSRCPSSVRPSVRPPFSKIFSSETAWPIKAKFYVEPPWEGATKVYINGPGHMTKMAATPIYDKNPSKIFFRRTGGPIFTKLGM